MRILYETTFLKIKGKTNAENSRLCLHNTSPLLENTDRTKQKLSKTYSDWLFSQNDSRIRNRNLILFTAEFGERKKKVMSVEFSFFQINGTSHIAWIILNL